MSSQISSQDDQSSIINSQQQTTESEVSSHSENSSDEIFEISAAGSGGRSSKKEKTSKEDDDEIEYLDLDEDLDSSDENELAASNIFESWGLSKELLKSLNDMNFTQPTPIQQQAIPLLLKRAKDFVGLAATGTGKTGAFGIPLVESIDTSKKAVQALVMCPTRELASQVEVQIQKLAKWKGLTTLTVFGGSSYDRQLAALKKGVHIVVGTPGRLCDLIDRKALKLNEVQTLVLDEADEMISMGFQDDLEKILEAIGESETKRKWLFSATMSPEIRRVVSKYLPDYDKVEIHRKDAEKPQIEQIYYTIYPDRKLQMLSSVLYMNPEFYGLIFCQTKREVQEITDWLKRKSFKVDCIHGDRPQREREFILKDFRSGRVKILVATDVAARGLDINDLTHVINFNLPREVESYVHRIGRTGRAGKKGLALSLVSPSEVRLLKRIQHVTKANLVKGVAPSNDELNIYRVKDVIQALNSVDTKDEVAFRTSKFLDRKMNELKDLFTFDFTVEEFLKRYLVAEHPDIFENRDTSMDFVGDGVVPREMLDSGGSKPRRDGRFGMGGRSFERSGDRGGRGGGDRFRSGGRSSDRRQDDSSRGSSDRFERSERGGRFTGGTGFRSRDENSGSRRDEGSGYKSRDENFGSRRDDSYGNRRSESSAGRRNEGATWNADESSDRPSRKRFNRDGEGRNFRK